MIFVEVAPANRERAEAALRAAGVERFQLLDGFRDTHLGRRIVSVAVLDEDAALAAGALRGLRV